MEPEIIAAFCESNPNAKPVKDGVLIETDEGILHLTHVLTGNEYEGLKDASFFAPFCSPDDLKKVHFPRSASDYLALTI